MKKIAKSLCLLLISAIISSSGCKYSSASDHFVNINRQTQQYSAAQPFEPINDTTKVSPTGDTDIKPGKPLRIHFIDVGQGDSSFIELPDGKSMLIDAGERKYGDTVTEYIHSLGYDSIDYVIATHVHSDHIGGMTTVLDDFDVEAFYKYDVSSTTKTYTDMISAIEDNNIAVYNVTAGDTLFEDTNLIAEVVAPKETDADEQNNNSVVIKLTYGNTKFVFTGDAEKSEEDGIWTNIKCDVLKVGHHGSKSSSSDNFLKKTEPTYAIISCGADNKYGHPSDETLNRLNKKNITVYRTDIQGTIICTSDGKNITMN